MTPKGGVSRHTAAAISILVLGFVRAGHLVARGNTTPPRDILVREGLHPNPGPPKAKSVITGSCERQNASKNKLKYTEVESARS